MSKFNDVSKYAYKIKMDKIFHSEGKPKKFTFKQMIKHLPEYFRLKKYQKRMAKRKTEQPFDIDFISMPNTGAVMGVPLGGIGTGSIMRGWKGDFNRWQIKPGKYSYKTVSANQFSIYVKHKGEKAKTTVINSNTDNQYEIPEWDWNLDGGCGEYQALYPIALTNINDDKLGLRMSCKQISPIIANNYKESSYPCCVFEWTVENIKDKDADIGLMFSFKNGFADENDAKGGHNNDVISNRDITLIKMHNNYIIQKRITNAIELKNPVMYQDPLTFAVATKHKPDRDVTYNSKFVLNHEGYASLWKDFKKDGKLDNQINNDPSKSGEEIGSAVCVSVKLHAGEHKKIVFSLAWDMPVIRFGDGRAWYRRYTKFFDKTGNSAGKISIEALNNYEKWENDIIEWQKPILENPKSPDWFKTMLINETYYLSDAGTVWTNGQPDGYCIEDDPMPENDDWGHFAYLEGHEYTMYNTYDVHFYASFCLCMLFPELELSLQRDFANSVFMGHQERHWTFGSGGSCIRKIKGAVPHDFGAPAEDPWIKTNVYNFHDTTQWKDLNSKLVLQVYRDYIATGDKVFLAECWEALQTAVDYLVQFDRDDDCMIENDGFPDQTYDAWGVKGVSSYTGSLWIACLTAMESISNILGENKKAGIYKDYKEKAKKVFENNLWEGRYYRFDNHSSYTRKIIMADQLAGQWYANICGLESVVKRENAVSSLKMIHKLNVKGFEDGNRGAVNSVLPNGKVDKSNIQSAEVWTGSTLGIASLMLSEGLNDEAWDTAWGIYHTSYEEKGYFFQTPEAWDYKGEFRALGYMRPLSVWAIQWVLDREKD